MKKRFLLNALFSTLAVLPCVSFGQTLKYLGPDMTDTFNINIIDGYSGGVYAGTESFSLNNGPSIDLFCVDLADTISPGDSYPVTLIETDTLAANNPFRIAGNIYAASIGSVTNADQAAGLQLALWDTVAPGGFTVSGVSGAAQAAATADLANAGISGNALLYYAGPGVGQSMMGAVPEPSSLGVLAIGALAFLRRRRS